VIETVLQPPQLHQQRAQFVVAERARVDGGQLVDRSPQ
jgi:hypothetical protein